MTSLELLKEIEAWLCFNIEPSKTETAKLRKSINNHVIEQLNLHNVNNSVCSCRHNTDLYCKIITYCNKCNKEVKTLRTN